MRSLERVNIRNNVRTYVLTYIRTRQTLYPLHNFVVRGDNKSITWSDMKQTILLSYEMRLQGMYTQACLTI